jgi:Cytochrome c554 and c-prime
MAWNGRMFPAVSRSMTRWLWLALLIGCRGEAGEVVVPIVATAEVKGTTEPCGCNSDPLGDVARVVEQANGGLLVDAGGLLYDKETAANKRPQAEAKARALAAIYKEAARVDEPPHVYEERGVRIGVFGVSKNDLGEARKSLAALKGAQVVVALFALPRAEARRLLAQLDGVWFGVVGADVGEGMAEAEPVGKAWLVAPADQARRVARIELHVKNGQPAPTMFAGADARKLQLDRAQKRIDALKAQLDEWQNDPTADASFVKARRDELTSLQAERDRLAASTPAPPAGSYFTYALVPVRRALPRDAKVAERLKELDREIGAANFAAAQHEASPAANGGPRYVGMSACVKCHKPAVEFWQKTVHAQAWKTLTSVNKQYNYDCTGCHVTGFEKPGGPNLAMVEKAGLTNVQCEVCHGPASKHVEEAGLDEPSTLIKRPAERFCADNCHTPEHSDTFQLVPYLRDVTGKGHGEKLRAQLGNGVTGHELRQKALGAAGR